MWRDPCCWRCEAKAWWSSIFTAGDGLSDDAWHVAKILLQRFYSELIALRYCCWSWSRRSKSRTNANSHPWITGSAWSAANRRDCLSFFSSSCRSLFSSIAALREGCPRPTFCLQLLCDLNMQRGSLTSWERKWWKRSGILWVIHIRKCAEVSSL